MLVDWITFREGHDVYMPVIFGPSGRHLALGARRRRKHLEHFLSTQELTHYVIFYTAVNALHITHEGPTAHTRP